MVEDEVGGCGHYSAHALLYREAAQPARRRLSTLGRPLAEGRASCLHGSAASTLLLAQPRVRPRQCSGLP